MITLEALTRIKMRTFFVRIRMAPRVSTFLLGMCFLCGKGCDACNYSVYLIEIRNEEITMNKQNFNFHTHTARCGHAEGLDEQYVNSAMEAGIKTLGFSDHIPYVEMRLPNCRMFYEYKDEYLTSIQTLKKKYQSQIDIKVGYEVEYMDGYADYLLQMRKECDYMILGQHCKNIGYEYDCYCSDEDVLTYVKQIEAALELGIISYIAHPDYFMLGRRFFSKICEEAAHRIARASISYDMPLEINLNGFRYGKKTYQFYDKPFIYEERYPYPFREFWEIISNYGCKVVYGYDAHSPIAFLEEDRMSKADMILKDLSLMFVKEIKLK